MSNFVFNTAKGRVGELYNRVDAGDPADSRLFVTILATSGLEADSVLIDKDFFSDVVSGTTNEVTNTVNGSSWATVGRKFLTGADLAAFSASVDDTNDRVDLDFGDQTWTAVAAGDGWSKLIVCYIPDGNASGGVSADSAVIPLTAHDFVVTPDGSDITAVINSAGFYRAA